MDRKQRRLSLSVCEDQSTNKSHWRNNRIVSLQQQTRRDTLSEDCQSLSEPYCNTSPDVLKQRVELNITETE